MSLQVVPEAAVAVCARDGGGIPELLAKVEEALLNLNAMVKCTNFVRTKMLGTPEIKGNAWHCYLQILCVIVKFSSKVFHPVACATFKDGIF